LLIFYRDRKQRFFPDRNHRPSSAVSRRAFSITIRPLPGRACTAVHMTAQSKPVLRIKKVSCRSRPVIPRYRNNGSSLRRASEAATLYRILSSLTDKKDRSKGGRPVFCNLGLAGTECRKPVYAISFSDYHAVVIDPEYVIAAFELPGNMLLPRQTCLQTYKCAH